MTRWVLIFLSVYTMLLACMPCQDEASENALVSVSTVAANTHQGHPAQMDLCSPFCICACCAGVTLQPQLPSVPFLSSFISFEEITFAYLPGKLTGDLTSIWQPPRI
ncbi:DUF6660 family protein [Dyadobacter luticola]|uniref:DUF2946 domain-containing protein n=1 Tax=Dyadobacter luticola TaxID=1979387 RepID=A0A5R9L1B6_9BACT|nr:DUF6660 family protein [Dyadobacter luticola]TLV02211.1 hypothetical protein FEN17_00795 [Dyadobacter luticola]